MPENQTNNQTNTQIDASSPAPSSISSTPVAPSASSTSSSPAQSPASSDRQSSSGQSQASAPSDGPASSSQSSSSQSSSSATIAEVLDHIADSHNILIALSANPTVDELSAAIALSLYLDRIGKRATAVYSGATPNALEFLNLEDALDDNTDSLQDFVIALDKEKADHLRYKLDGDYVKIYITPFRVHIGEEDLDFSYGDFNIDLILALNVKNGSDLDATLREHGRIMHSATVINITTEPPHRYGDIEWSEPTASSVSELAADLVFQLGENNDPIDQDEATALLTGIIAATDRFSSDNVSPNTMQIASRLMTAGADQRLITQNISEIGNQILNSTNPSAKTPNNDATMLSIARDATKAPTLTPSSSLASTPPAPAVSPVAPNLVAPLTPASSFMAASMAASGAANADDSEEEPMPADPTETPPAILSSNSTETPPAALSSNLNEPPLATAPSAPAATPFATAGAEFGIKPEKVVAPSADFAAAAMNSTISTPSAPVSAALAELPTPTTQPLVATPTPQPFVTTPAPQPPTVTSAELPITPSSAQLTPSSTPAATALNPAAAVTPSAPETAINGVPVINYSEPADSPILPPPPAPPVDLSSPLPVPSATPSPADSSTFKLPGV